MGIQLSCGGKDFDTYDLGSKKTTKIGAQLTKLSQKQFSLSLYGMLVGPEVRNLTR